MEVEGLTGLSERSKVVVAAVGLAERAGGYGQAPETPSARPGRLTVCGKLGYATTAAVRFLKRLCRSANGRPKRSERKYFGGIPPASQVREAHAGVWQKEKKKPNKKKKTQKKKNRSSRAIDEVWPLLKSSINCSRMIHSCQACHGPDLRFLILFGGRLARCALAPVLERC